MNIDSCGSSMMSCAAAMLIDFDVSPGLKVTVPLLGEPISADDAVPPVTNE